MQLFLTEMPRTLCGWHTSWKCFHMYCVGGMLEAMWSREFIWVSRILCNQDDFGWTAEVKKKKGFTEDSNPGPVYAAQLFQYSTHQYFFGDNKKKKSSRLCFISHQCFCFSLLYDNYREIIPNSNEIHGFDFSNITIGFILLNIMNIELYLIAEKTFFKYF